MRSPVSSRMFHETLISVLKPWSKDQPERSRCSEQANVLLEQHCFGVAQRLKLRGKAMGEAHQLMMSATPIPRTLAMTFYATSMCRCWMRCRRGERPSPRISLNNRRRPEIVERVRAACARGHKPTGRAR